MKVVAINGSPRKNGNTAILLEAALAPIRAEGIGTEVLNVGQDPVAGCIACYGCVKSKDRTCAQKGDPMNEYIAKCFDADALIIGSPTYFADLTAQVKAFIDRLGVVSMANGRALSRKVGAAVTAQRRAGATNAMDSINKLFLISGMVVPGSTYWNLGNGREKGEVEKDAEGLANMEDLGKNIAWLLKKIHA